MVGVLGTVSSALRAGGTGEMIFSRNGARYCAAIRSQGGNVIERGVEVVVLDYRDGIAFVRPWEELNGFRNEGI